MTDTRAGFWLLLSTVLITAVAVVLIVIVGDAGDVSLQDMVASRSSRPRCCCR